MNYLRKFSLIMSKCIPFYVFRIYLVKFFVLIALRSCKLFGRCEKCIEYLVSCGVCSL